MEYYINNILIEIDDDLVDREVMVTGRIRSIHDAKTKFVHIERDGHKFQLMIRSSNECKNVELSNSDIIQAYGVIEKNARGNIVMCPNQITILSRAVKKIGKTYSEKDLVSDPETLYRHPYIGMIKDRELINTLKYQAGLLQRIRDLLNKRDFVEVYTPVLVNTNGGAVAKPFKTYHNALNKNMCLRIAPELNLKRLMIGGMEAIYEIGPSFRNEGVDKTHNPEFISLEAYKAYETYEYWIQWFNYLLFSIGQDKEYSLDRIDLSKIPGVTPENAIEKLEEMVQNFGDTAITIVEQFPASDSPLAARNKNNLDWCDRFEIYLGKMEVVNGYTELTDPVIQRNIMKEQAKLKGDEFEYDEEYCNALEFGLVPCAGIGIGINRLIMWLLGKSNIKDVLSFPFYK